MADLPHVLIPTGYGDLAVVDLGELLGYLSEDDSLETAVFNSAFDHIQVGGPMEQLRQHVLKVRQLNEDGDVGAYWDRP